MLEKMTRTRKKNISFELIKGRQRIAGLCYVSHSEDCNFFTLPVVDKKVTSGTQHL